MFSRKKPEPPKKRNHEISQFGLTEIPDDFDPSGVVPNNGDDNDLEADLSPIVGDGGKKKPEEKPKHMLIPASDLDKMIADSMRDIGSDEELPDDDPELLDELSGITGDDVDPAQSEPTNEEVAPEQQIFLPTTIIDTISIIKNRIEMYKLAESAAKTSGESARARRFNRGLKTLNDLLKQCVTGQTINADDIPPEVTVKTPEKKEEPTSDATETPKSPMRPAPALPSRPAPVPPQKTSSVEEKTEPPKDVNPFLAKLNERENELD